MAIGNSWTATLRDRELARLMSFSVRVLTFAFLFVAGCGAPGEPTPPSPPIPVAVTDLSAQQAGDGVQLTWHLDKGTLGHLSVEVLGPGGTTGREIGGVHRE